MRNIAITKTSQVIINCLRKRKKLKYNVSFLFGGGMGVQWEKSVGEPDERRQGNGDTGVIFMCVRVLSHLSRVQTLHTPWTVAHQDLLSMGFSRQGYWSGLPFPSPYSIFLSFYNAYKLCFQCWKDIFSVVGESWP